MKYLCPGVGISEVADKACSHDLADFSLPGLRDWLNEPLKQEFATLHCYSEKSKYYVQ